MRTIKYWWRVLIWHPLDIADRTLVLVGGVSGYLQKGNDPITIGLTWQIPLGAIVLFLIWRLMQAPVKIINDIRRERRGEFTLTLEGINQRIQKIENTVNKLQEKIEPQSTFDIEDIKQKVFWNFKTFDNSMIGGITRSVAFVFDVTNASPLWINTTGNVKGDLIILAWRLMGVHWQVVCNGIEAGKKGEVRIIFPVSENFARTLAFKPKEGFFSAEFSEMLVEFETNKDNQQRHTLGYIPIGNRSDIPIKDHPAFQKIRKIVQWEGQLGNDDLIMR